MLIDAVNVVDSLGDEILHDEVALVAVGEGVAGPLDKFSCLLLKT